MRRDPRSFLWDVRDAADAIASFVEGKNYPDHARDRMMRSAVEQELPSLRAQVEELLAGLTRDAN